jgi:hypothetical protein
MLPKAGGSLRILYVLFALQHPRLRGPNRHYHFLRELSRRHAITLLAITAQPIPGEILEELTGYTERLWLFDAEPPSLGGPADATASQRHDGRWSRVRRQRRAAHGMQACLGRQIAAANHSNQRFDVVLLHGKNLASVVKDRAGLPLVVEFCDAASQRLRARRPYVPPARRLALALQVALVRRHEQRVARMTPHLAFISARDRAAVLGPDSRAMVIPNGVDLTYWQRSAAGLPSGSRLLFTGIMNYTPNEDAALYLADHVLPRLRSAGTDVELVLAGRDPTAALRACAERQPGVTVTGYVEDLRPYLEQAMVFVAPLRFASGMQNKVQEAMAMGVPVVATATVAAGLTIDPADPPPLVVADGADAIAAQVRRLLGEPAERARLAEAGRCFAERYFVWPRSAAQLARLCHQAVADKTSA